jgi:hypothetical protein
LRKCVGCVGLFALSLLGACGGSVVGPTSGQIGCAEKDITITDDEMGWSSRTWKAECHGKTYFCSAHQSAEHGAQVSCKEANTKIADSEPKGKKEAAKSGCEYDTQCKGDRICSKGACVDPQQPSVDSKPASPPVASEESVTP